MAKRGKTQPASEQKPKEPSSPAPPPAVKDGGQRKPNPGEIVPDGGLGPKSNYTAEFGVRIAQRYGEGYTMSQLVRCEDMPKSQNTIDQWRWDHPEFDRLMEQAFRRRIKRMADQLEDISDDGTNDWMEREIELKGGRTMVKILCDHEHIQRSRLRWDTRRWLLSKVYPKLYGENLAGLDDLTPEDKARQIRMALKQMKELSDG